MCSANDENADSTSGWTDHGNSTTILCLTGFVLKGKSRHTCTNREWSTSLPEFDVKPNGIYNYRQSYTFIYIIVNNYIALESATGAS